MSTWKMHLANFVYDVKFNIFHEEGRGGNRATKFLAELISSLKYKTSSNATIHSLVYHQDLS